MLAWQLFNQLDNHSTSLKLIALNRWTFFIVFTVFNLVLEWCPHISPKKTFRARKLRWIIWQIVVCMIIGRNVLGRKVFGHIVLEPFWITLFDLMLTSVERMNYYTNKTPTEQKLIRCNIFLSLKRETFYTYQLIWNNSLHVVHFSRYCNTWKSLKTVQKLHQKG